MQSIGLQLIIDGVSTKDHKIDLQDLIPALTGLSEIIQIINKEEYGDNSKVNIMMKPIDEGSIKIDFEVVQNIVEKFSNIFSKENTDHLNSILDILLKGRIMVSDSAKTILGWLGLVKESAKQNIPLSQIKFTETDNKRILKAQFPGGEAVLVYSLVSEMIKNPRIRAGTSSLTKSLDTDGIEKITFLRDHENDLDIIKEDRPFFDLPKVEETPESLNIRTSNEYLQIISPNFDPEKTLMWEFMIDERKKKVEILDEDFLKKVRSHEYTFGFGDILNCTVEKATIIENLIVKEKWLIIKVIDFKPIKKNQSLFKD